MLSNFLKQDLGGDSLSAEFQRLSANTSINSVWMEISEIFVAFENTDNLEEVLKVLPEVNTIKALFLYLMIQRPRLVNCNERPIFSPGHENILKSVEFKEAKLLPYSHDFKIDKCFYETPDGRQEYKESVKAGILSLRKQMCQLAFEALFSVENRSTIFEKTSNDIILVNMIARRNQLIGASQKGGLLADDLIGRMCDKITNTLKNLRKSSPEILVFMSENCHRNLLSNSLKHSVGSNTNTLAFTWEDTLNKKGIRIVKISDNDLPQENGANLFTENRAYFATHADYDVSRLMEKGPVDTLSSDYMMKLFNADTDKWEELSIKDLTDYSGIFGLDNLIGGDRLKEYIQTYTPGDKKFPFIKKYNSIDDTYLERVDNISYIPCKYFFQLKYLRDPRSSKYLKFLSDSCRTSRVTMGLGDADEAIREFVMIMSNARSSTENDPLADVVYNGGVDIGRREQPGQNTMHLTYFDLTNAAKAVVDNVVDYFLNSTKTSLILQKW